MVAQPRPDSRIGKAIGRDGRYLIERRLGHGGYGEIYLARDQKLQVSVAVKLLHEGKIDPVTQERFRREGSKYGAALSHPNIARVLDTDKEGSTPFIVMEFIEGRTLAQIIDAHETITVDEALRVAREIAIGLQAAHGVAVVHRDLKPSNVMIQASDSAVKIIDFGIAKDMLSAGMLTKSRAYLGTPGYSAPEQIGHRDIDHRADIFALGVILYELLTGKVAFNGRSTLEILNATRHKKPIPPTKLNKQVTTPVATLIKKMIRKSPDQRHASMGEVIAAIDDVRQAIAGGLNRDQTRGIRAWLRRIFEGRS